MLVRPAVVAVAPAPALVPMMVLPLVLLLLVVVVPLVAKVKDAVTRTWWSAARRVARTREPKPKPEA